MLRFFLAVVHQTKKNLCNIFSPFFAVLQDNVALKLVLILIYIL
jgi:hypothetical protein